MPLQHCGTPTEQVTCSVGMGSTNTCEHKQQLSKLKPFSQHFLIIMPDV
jgi:hypothetical protein